MISELLAYDFMQRAILAVIAISIFSPILGLFLILRRQSLMSDTLSHVSLAGVAVGIFLGQSTTWMTLVVVQLCYLLLFGLGISQGQLQALYGDFNGYPHVNGIGSGSYS